MSEPPSLPPKPSQGHTPALPPKKTQSDLNPTSSPQRTTTLTHSPALPKKPTPMKPQYTVSPDTGSAISPSSTPSLPPKTNISKTPQQAQSQSASSVTSPPPPPQQAQHVKPTTQKVEPIFSLPETFTLLPNAEILKLCKSLDVLRGFLITQIEAEKEANLSQLNQYIEQLESFKLRLQTILKEKQATNEALEALQLRVKEWESAQADMYAALDKFSHGNVQRILVEAVNDAKALSDSIESSFLSYSGVHDDDSVQEFLDNYMKERTLYYMRREKLARFNEGRIGGL